VDRLAPHCRVRANPLSYNTDIGLPLAILGTELDTRRPLAIAAGFARAAWSAVVTREPLDVMVLELGVRRAGDMRAHLEIVRPDVVVVTPVAASYRDDLEAIEILREEIALLCRDAAARGATVLLCADDPVLAALADEIPGAVRYAAGEATADAGGPSAQRAQAATAHVIRALGFAG
jgi:UDP-N-acetylmuramyl pentapeptide synthase